MPTATKTSFNEWMKLWLPAFHLVLFLVLTLPVTNPAMTSLVGKGYFIGPLACIGAAFAILTYLLLRCGLLNYEWVKAAVDFYANLWALIGVVAVLVARASAGDMLDQLQHFKWEYALVASGIFFAFTARVVTALYALTDEVPEKERKKRALLEQVRD